MPNDGIETPKVQPVSQEIDPLDFEYKEFSGEPVISFSKLTLIILAPALVVIHIAVAHFFALPMIQYSFVTSLTAFIINYTWIIRKHELMPYLPVESFDNRLKVLCVLSLTGMLLSMHFGWNGSGGMIFAIYWEITRSSKIGIYGLFFGSIIVGSLLMEKNYTVSKLWEFLPGLIFGYVNSEIFKLKDSNPYTIAHQFIFLCSIGFPIFFPASKLVVPSLFQWIVMLVFGAILLFTVIVIIKLMQSTRVSVVMGVLSGLLILGTSTYTSGIDYLGFVLIAVGVAMLLKKEFYEI
jgi:hypothetical protein